MPATAPNSSPGWASRLGERNLGIHPRRPEAVEPYLCAMRAWPTHRVMLQRTQDCGVGYGTPGGTDGAGIRPLCARRVPGSRQAVPVRWPRPVGPPPTVTTPGADRHADQTPPGRSAHRLVSSFRLARTAGTMVAGRKDDSQVSTA